MSEEKMFNDRRWDQTKERKERCFFSLFSSFFSNSAPLRGLLERPPPPVFSPDFSRFSAGLLFILNWLARRRCGARLECIMDVGNKGVGARPHVRQTYPANPVGTYPASLSNLRARR